MTFNNSVIAFCTERFIEIEIILDKENGLKIPNSSIVEKEFFLIPEQYIMLGSNSTSEYMVNRLTYDSKGERIKESINQESSCFKACHIKVSKFIVPIPYAFSRYNWFTDFFFRNQYFCFLFAGFEFC